MANNNIALSPALQTFFRKLGQMEVVAGPEDLYQLAKLIADQLREDHKMWSEVAPPNLDRMVTIYFGHQLSEGKYTNRGPAMEFMVRLLGAYNMYAGEVSREDVLEFIDQAIKRFDMIKG